MAGRNLVLAAIVLLAAFPRDARELAALDIVTIASALLSLAALYSTQSVLTRTARTMPRRP
jgi:ABC-type transporter Mla MlaB component